jgi:hypothetical protein
MFVERKKYDYENLFDYYFELLNYLIVNNY